MPRDEGDSFDYVVSAVRSQLQTLMEVMIDLLYYVPFRGNSTLFSRLRGLLERRCGQARAKL